MFGGIEDITLMQPQGKFHYVFVKYMYRDDAINSYLVKKKKGILTHNQVDIFNLYINDRP